MWRKNENISFCSRLADVHGSRLKLAGLAVLLRSFFLHQGSGCPPVLSTAEAMPWVLCPFVFSLKKGQWGAGMVQRRAIRLRKVQKYGIAEGTGIVYSWGGSRGTSSHSTATWKDVVVRWRSVSSSMHALRGQEEITCCWDREDSD